MIPDHLQGDVRDPQTITNSRQTPESHSGSSARFAYRNPEESFQNHRYAGGSARGQKLQNR